MGALKPRALTFDDAGITASLGRLVARLDDAPLVARYLWDVDAPLPCDPGSQTAEWRAVITGRVRLGERLEALVHELLDLLEPGEPGEPGEPQLWFDGYAAAVWTSCHARILELIAAGRSSFEAQSMPTVMTVPCAASEYSMCFLLDYVIVRGCGRDMKPLLQLMLRSANHGNRGWVTMASRFVSGAASASTRHVLNQAVLVSLCGLHPFVDPRKRPNWQERAVILRRVSTELSLNTGAWIQKHMHVLKEVNRRMLATALFDSVAALDVIFALDHPIAKLLSPPEALPAVGMREASAHVCAIGRLCLDTDPGAFHVAHSSTASKNLMALEDTHWVGRSGCTSTPATMIERARDIFHSAFRANFGPMWLHALGKGHRAHRLDPPQYDGVHQNNAAALLCAQLDEASALYATRVALQSTAAATYTMGEAVFALGLDRDGKRAAEVIDIGNRCSRHATSTLVAAAPLGSRALGMLLQFARTAQICETVLIVELGARTAALHEQALRRRFGSLDVPNHLKSISYCCECSRVCNALAGAKPRTGVPGILEFGLSAVTVGSGGCTRCARRSSAALRSAQQAQAQAAARELDGDDLNGYDMHCDEVARTSHDGSVASRLRRDAKSVHGQRRTALPCGSTPLLTKTVVGRIERIEGLWYTLCSWCGVHMSVSGAHHYESELCCFQCDPSLVDPEGSAVHRCGASTSADGGVDGAAGASDAATGRQCRFCMKTETRKTSTFMRVTSPLDESPANRNLPPSLRVTYWCKAHYRTWIPNAMRMMQSHEVNAHILEKAKPLAVAHMALGAHKEQDHTDDGGNGGNGDGTTNELKSKKKANSRRESIRSFKGALAQKKRSRKQRAIKEDEEGSEGNVLSSSDEESNILRPGKKG